MVRVPNQVPPDTPEVIEDVVDHLVHIGYDERTVLRLTAATGDEESMRGGYAELATPGLHLRWLLRFWSAVQDSVSVPSPSG